ncbi:hypothetical protein [Marinomonas spartinae]|uniref:hypothetical protein n=1 Tax=Marinomonas spartinae TaxID=1792290 RepID=UPI0018F190D3|nr:hypothetical protein [Marinomonas spartinae]MBJ7556459.1 hypothetical protein [Marinomonas spartinae]
MYSLKAKALYDHVAFFRELVNGRLAKGPKGNESFPEYVKRALKLNSEKDWKFICSGMDLIGDTSLSIDHFLRFGLEGVSRYNDVGEKYLRLYGVLNSTYIQQEAVFKLCKLCQISEQPNFRSKLENLEIRDIRHKLGAHSVDYIDKHKEDVLSFVPIRFDMSGFHLNYINNNDFSQKSVGLLSGINEHLDLMTEIMNATLEKTKNTLYKSNPEKINEIDAGLEELRVKRIGGHVHYGEDGQCVIFSPEVGKI